MQEKKTEVFENTQENMLTETQIGADGGYVRQAGEEQTGGVYEVQTGNKSEGKKSVQQTNKGREGQTGRGEEMMEQEPATLSKKCRSSKQNDNVGVRIRITKHGGTESG